MGGGGPGEFEEIGTGAWEPLCCGAPHLHLTPPPRLPLGWPPARPPARDALERGEVPPAPLQGTQPTPSHGLPDGKRPLQRHFVTDSNRPQPLWQPPPGAASEVPSLLMHPCPPPRLAPSQCPPRPPQGAFGHCQCYLGGRVCVIARGVERPSVMLPCVHRPLGGEGGGDSSWRVTDGGWGISDGGWRVTDGSWRATDGGWGISDIGGGLWWSTH